VCTLGFLCMLVTDVARDKVTVKMGYWIHGHHEGAPFTVIDETSDTYHPHEAGAYLSSVAALHNDVLPGMPPK